MDNNEVKFQDLDLFCRKGVGPITYKRLLEYQSEGGIDKEVFELRFKLDYPLLQNVIKDSFDFVTYRTSNYPQLLKEIADSPIILFYKGDLSLFEIDNLVGIAGTRDPTDYGISVCKDLVKLANSNVAFVTGLALGVDTVIAEECLNRGIKVIGVLPASIKNVVPNSNKKLVDKIVSTGGLIVWENPLSSVTNGSFIQRNRIIAGISTCLVIVEADLKSGSITTADFAFDYDREVYAVPGKIYSSKSRGTNYLIKENKARMLANLADLPGLIDGNLNTTVQIKNLDKIEQKIYYAILDEPKGLDDLLKICSEYSNLLSKLLNLELLGYIKKAHDGKYKIV